MLLTRRSLKDSCTAVFKLHKADTMQNIAFSLFTFYVAHNLSFLYYFQITCGLTFSFFKLNVAHTLQNPMFAVLCIECGLHMAEYFFADFPLYVAGILQNRYSIILYCLWSYIDKTL